MTSPYGALSDELEGLRWKTQHASHDRNSGNDLLHDMLEAGKASINGKSSYEEVAAMAFLFDNGIFYLPEADRLEVAAKLRAISTIQSGGSDA